MTDTNQTPGPTPAEQPTTPMPVTPEAPPVAGSAPPVTAPYDPNYPAHHHGLHVDHRVSEGAIAAMVIGAIVFAMLSFGLGWAARGAVARFGNQGAGAGYGYGQGYGQGFGGLPQDHPNIGPGGGMRGRGYGRGMRGQGFGQGQGGWQSAPDASTTPTGTGLPY